MERGIGKRGLILLSTAHTGFLTIYLHMYFCDYHSSRFTMGLFGRKKDRAKATQSNGSNGGTGTLVAKESAPQQTSLNQTKKTPPAQVASQKQKATSGKTTANSKEPTLAMVTELIQDLATAEQTSGDRPASALRSLFALSEHSSDGQNRVQMVRIDGAKLVPVLLAFLQRCARGSSEQYLALLVLNNVSIPSENKRVSYRTHLQTNLLFLVYIKNPDRSPSNLSLF